MGKSSGAGQHGPRDTAAVIASRYVLTDKGEAAVAAIRVPRRKPRHRHTYERVGYGGAGWSLYRCTTCGAEEIDA